MLIPWTSIDLFHNVRKTFTELKPAGDSKVKYRAKVKLHGTNAAIQRLADGTIECQSREQVLSITKDNAGFARWVDGVRIAWVEKLAPGQVVFGEWCGPGIQDIVAVCGIPKKVFAVFAMLDLNTMTLVVEPAELAQIVPPGVAYVLPWHESTEIEVDWMETPEALESVTARINSLVDAVETCDPWVKTVFGVEGTGEGLVFYPQGQPNLDATYLRMFKAKGDKHRVVKSKVAAQVNPDVAASCEAFAELVLPEARLEQGATATTPEGARFKYDNKRVGAFLGWINKDVAKETQNELTASGLDPKLAAKAVTDRARKWYLAKVASEA
jgi:hypothetical protein